MSKQQFKSSLGFVFAALSLQILIIPSLQTKLPAQTAFAQQTFGVTFTPPEDGKPANSAGGASRSNGQCLQEARNLNQYVTPLLPKTNFGLTTQAHPTLFVYIPQISAKKAFLSVQDENNNTHYQTFISLPAQSGVMTISLPNDAPELAIGKNYKWSLVIMCNNVLRPDSPLVEGVIKRIEPDSALKKELEQATPLESASFYAKAGIWYETLTTLAQLRSSEPEDATLPMIWEQLLESVGLETVATEPILQ